MITHLSIYFYTFQYIPIKFIHKYVVKLFYKGSSSNNEKSLLLGNGTTTVNASNLVSHWLL